MVYPHIGVEAGAKGPNFWVRIEDTEDKDLLTYQNEILQTCNPYDIITTVDEILRVQLT